MRLLVDLCFVCGVGRAVKQAVGKVAAQNIADAPIQRLGIEYAGSHQRGEL